MTITIISLYFALLALSLFVLIQSGVIIMRSLVHLARLWDVSEYALSFVFMSFATTLPEFVVGINAAFSGEPIIALGNIMGANILNLALVLGLAAVIAGIIKIDESVTAHDAWFTFVLGISPLVLLMDGELSSVEGGLLILLFFSYIIKLIRGQHVFQKGKNLWISNNGPTNESARIRSPRQFFREIGLFILAVFLLLAAAKVIVDIAIKISSGIGISGFFVGVFLIAFGTTLPEISFMFRSVFGKHSNLSIGNLVGATAFNSTWILGVIAIIHPIRVSGLEGSFVISAVVLTLVLFFANLFMRTGFALTRREGFGLLSLYAIFVCAQAFF